MLIRQLVAGLVATPTSPPGTTPSPLPGSTVIADLLPAWGFEEKLLVTAALGVAVFVMGGFVVPWAIDRVRRAYSEQLPTERVDEWLAHAEEALPFGVRTYYLVRTTQTVLMGAAALILLVIWGQTRAAVGALELFAASLPRLLQIVFSVGLFVGAYVAVDMLEEFVDRIARESDRIDEHQGEIVFRVLQVVLIVSAGLVVLSIWDVELGGLLVGAGFLGIVVGMAARQTLGSLLAGFVLMFSKPFEVGDWIEVGGHEGVVTDITIVNTRLENFDGEYVVMPNDVISNSTIINRTRKGRLRVRLEVGIDYAVDPDRAADVAKDAMTDLDEVMSVPRPQVVPTEFDDSAILLELRFWIDKPSSRRRWRARAAVLQGVYEAFESAGIKIPYPQRELSGRAETGGFRVSRDGVREPAVHGEQAPAEPADGEQAPSEAADEQDATSEPANE